LPRDRFVFTGKLIIFRCDRFVFAGDHRTERSKLDVFFVQQLQQLLENGSQLGTFL